MMKPIVSTIARKVWCPDVEPILCFEDESVKSLRIKCQMDDLCDIIWNLQGKVQQQDGSMGWQSAAMRCSGAEAWSCTV